LEVLIGIAGALIGGASILVAGLLEARRQRLAEQRKEVQLAVASLTRTLGEAAHSIQWLAWKAKFTPRELNEAAIASYNKEMHRSLPKILGDLAVVSALDIDLFAKMVALAKELYELDAAMAMAAADFGSNPARSTLLMAQHVEPTLTFYRELNERVAGIFREAS
jgi:hypothetical protein